MFTGQYLCELDSKGRFVVPKPFREILARNAEEDKALFFAAAKTLRVYSQLGVQGYVAEMEKRLAHDNGSVAMRLLRTTLSGGLAFYTGSGRVAIPGLFSSLYRLAPGMRLILLGCGNFFEIDSLRE